jgi:hypothetical protein
MFWSLNLKQAVQIRSERMSNQKILTKLEAIEVRQPSVFEGIARIIDISNALDNDYEYFAQKRGTYVVNLESFQNSIEASESSLNADWSRIYGDFSKAASKIERNYYRRLRAV